MSGDATDGSGVLGVVVMGIIAIVLMVVVFSLVLSLPQDITEEDVPDSAYEKTAHVDIDDRGVHVYEMGGAESIRVVQHHEGLVGYNSSGRVFLEEEGTYEWGDEELRELDVERGDLFTAWEHKYDRNIDLGEYYHPDLGEVHHPD